MENDLHPQSLAVHAGMNDKSLGALSPPIYPASTYAFKNADEGAAIHEGEIPGYFYARIGNPTQTTLESAISELEGAESAIAFSSGMAAISNSLLTLLTPGDHLVAPRSLYSSTGSLIQFLEKNMKIGVSLVDATDPANYDRAVTSKTRLLYLESPANPTLQLSDLRAIAGIAKKHKILTICDNTFATPINQRPLQLGIDMVVHSMTKYIGGHADLLAGVMAGPKAIVEKCRWSVNKLLGSVPAPQVCWLALRGVRTLALRMEKHNANALEIASFLEAHPVVRRVYYPGLTSYPQHELAKKQMSGFGGMIAFDLESAIHAKSLIDQVRLCTLAVSLGDVSTLIQHSASMTHASVPRAVREKGGISEGLIRLSVGIENAQDIIADLDRALTKI